MYLIIGFAILTNLILIALLIPRDAAYEIWPRPHRLTKSVGDDHDNDLNQRSKTDQGPAGAGRR
jgi:hypothetical protein